MAFDSSVDWNAVTIAWAAAGSAALLMAWRELERLLGFHAHAQWTRAPNGMRVLDVGFAMTGKRRRRPFELSVYLTWKG